MRPNGLDPRVIRIGKAPAYLGMDRSTFNRTIRPYVDIIKLSKQARGIEKADLDRAWEDYKKDNIVEPAIERKYLSANPLSFSNITPGKSTKRSQELDAFERAREQVISRRRKKR